MTIHIGRFLLLNLHILSLFSTQNIAFNITSNRCGLLPYGRFKSTRLKAEERGIDGFINTSAPSLFTSPLYYLNSSPHLGHAYTVVTSDVFKRYYKLKGIDTSLIVGTDEHGSKIESSARKLGKNVQEHVEELRNTFLDMFKAYNIESDYTAHTSLDCYKFFVKSIFNHLKGTGDIYEGLHKGYFSPDEDLYFPESQLVNGKSPNGFDVVPIAEPAYFFKLSRWRDKLIHFYGVNDAILPRNRSNELLNILKYDIYDIAISRSNCTWGTNIHDNQYIYVWFEALLSYLYHMIENAKGNNANIGSLASSGIPLTYHVIGKDILNFHGLLWPAMLMSLGLEPRVRLIVHGWILNTEGNKMSKSQGTVVPAMPLEFQSDVYRYALMTLGYFGDDFKYYKEWITNSHNLVLNKYAVTCHRITGVLDIHNVGELTPLDYVDPLIKKFDDSLKELDSHMSNARIDQYIETVNEMVSELNKYLTTQRIWLLKPGDEFNKIMWTSCTAILYISIAISPIMPNLAERIINTIKPFHNNQMVHTESITFKLLNNWKHYTYKPIHQKVLT